MEQKTSNLKATLEVAARISVHSTVLRFQRVCTYGTNCNRRVLPHVMCTNGKICRIPLMQFLLCANALILLDVTPCPSASGRRVNNNIFNWPCRKAECMDFLVQAGASVNILDQEGRLPLHYAASKNHYQGLLTLVSAGLEKEIVQLMYIHVLVFFLQ